MSNEKYGSGNSDEPVRLSTHIVETGDFSVNDAWGEGIEAMYARLQERAQADKSMVLSVVQTVNTIQYVDPKTNLFEPRLIVVLTAQRMSLDEIARQQRMAQFGPGGPRR